MKAFRSLIAASLFAGLGVCGGSALAQASASPGTPLPASNGAPGKASPPSPAASGCAPGSADASIAPKLTIRTARVLVGSDARAEAPAKDAALAGSAASAGPVGAADSIDARKQKLPANLLVSSADVEIGIDGESYDAVVAYKTKCKADLKLFINGVDASPAATLFAQLRQGDRVLLRYHLAGGSAAQTLWKPLYRTSGLVGQADLDMAYGWASTGPSGDASPGVLEALQIAVAPPARQVWASAVLILVVLLTVVVLLQTDTFRDPPPMWLRIYRLHSAVYATSNAVDQLAILTNIDPVLAALPISCAELAAQAARGEVISENSDAKGAAIGLLVRGGPALQPSYSLTRLQMGMWFLFAVCTGVFLWIVYGELPPVTGSLLAILGISVGTTGASIAAGPSNDGSASTASRGLLLDIVTGADQSQHVHRYQSVIVNLLLLVVGGYYVSTELGFPTFDNTWLAFLGVSGATFAGGKQILEKPASGT